MESAFWDALDRLVAQSQLVIDRPKNSAHPRYPHCIYPADYGYLAGTSSMDGGGIDLWRGTAENQTVDAIICTVDLVKRDSEIKVLVGCTQAQQQTILAFHNDSEFMKGILIPRDKR